MYELIKWFLLGLISAAILLAVIGFLPLISQAQTLPQSTEMPMTTVAWEVDTTKAVIHHTASPDWPVERFRKIHIEERGWDDVGYHFIIRKDGTIEEGRSLSKQGAHAKGYRNGWIGIALTGYDEFTSLQLSSLKKLINKFGILHLERHHNFCPGKGLNHGIF